jgi:hypothetical protein
MKFSATLKLNMIRSAVESVGDTLTAPEAISFIASLFPRRPPGQPSPVRIPREHLPELLAYIASVVDKPRHSLRKR